MRFKCGSFVFICWAFFFNIQTCLGVSCGGRQNGNCPRGQYCHLSETGCETTPLYQSCSPMNFFKCCPDTCRITCLYGFKPDGNNCTLCECLPNPCDNVECLPPRRCYPDYIYNMGFRVYRAICECDKSSCQPCPNGYLFENGCKTCQCLTICKNVTCPPQHACVNLPGGEYMCDPRPQVCQAKSCNTVCPYGYKSDEKNCPSCECLPNPCDGVDCISPRACHPRLRTGSTYPPYEARCECPKLECFFCLNGYVFKNGCQTCECFDVCSTVSCPVNQVCTAYSGKRYVCQNYLPTLECPLVTCQPCQAGYVTDTNGCPTCECKDNCQSCVGLLCDEGKLCCGDLKGCYSCRRPEQCLLVPDPCLGNSCRPVNPPPCLASCGSKVCGSGTTCCTDARGCYECRRYEECVINP